VLDLLLAAELITEEEQELLLLYRFARLKLELLKLLPYL
jgi:hypothetical protein